MLSFYEIDRKFFLCYIYLMNTFGSLHYNAIAPVLKAQFGKRLVKLSLDGGFTCPNRDGSKGIGGCIFCSSSGSGDFASDIPSQIKLLSRKWPDCLYLAYFQNFTNTYAPIEKLKRLYDAALSYENVVGLAIATRPDCLSDEILDLLSEYNKKTFLWAEMGLQTSNEKTGLFINRCFENKDYERACLALSDRKIKTVTHLILNLPGESFCDMHNSLNYVCKFNPFGIKLHQLHIMKNTRLAAFYPEKIKLMELSDYISLVCDLLEELPKNVTVHRLTGDAPRDLLIAPLWSQNKHTVLNGIQQEFKRRGTYQGFKLEV